jgi:nicotinate-nucleotide adenylyltransferase
LQNYYRSQRDVQRFGLLGGTFDPIHYGHLVIAEEVRTGLELAEMVFVPAGQPPHKPGKTITEARYRLAMLELAIASNSHFSISTVEIERPGPSYTVDTLRLLHEQWGEETEIYFVIGWDSLEELPTWYNPEGMLEQVTHLVAVHRPGYIEVPGYRDQLEERLPGLKQRLLTMPAPQLEISATDLRQRVAEGRPIKYQTPEAVEQYIIEYRLYGQGEKATQQYDTHAS